MSVFNVVVVKKKKKIIKIEKKCKTSGLIRLGVAALANSYK